MSTLSVVTTLQNVQTIHIKLDGFQGNFYLSPEVLNLVLDQLQNEDNRIHVAKHQAENALKEAKSKQELEEIQAALAPFYALPDEEENSDDENGSEQDSEWGNPNW